MSEFSVVLQALGHFTVVAKGRKEFCRILVYIIIVLLGIIKSIQKKTVNVKKKELRMMATYIT